MFGSNTRKANTEMKNLVQEARQLLDKAGETSNESADVLHKKGIELLKSGISKAHDFQADALKSGKELASNTDTFVRENPWRSVAITGAIAAGIGLIVGLSSNRK